MPGARGHPLGHALRRRCRSRRARRAARVDAEVDVVGHAVRGMIGRRPGCRPRAAGRACAKASSTFIVKLARQLPPVGTPRSQLFRGFAHDVMTVETARNRSRRSRSCAPDRRPLSRSCCSTSAIGGHSAIAGASRSLRPSCAMAEAGPSGSGPRSIAVPGGEHRPRRQRHARIDQQHGRSRQVVLDRRQIRSRCRGRCKPRSRRTPAHRRRAAPPARASRRAGRAPRAPAGTPPRHRPSHRRARRRPAGSSRA